MNDYYCEICEKTIQLKSKTKQIGSEGHSHLNYYVRRKHSLGDIYWKILKKLFVIMSNLIFLIFPS